MQDNNDLYEYTRLMPRRKIESGAKIFFLVATVIGAVLLLDWFI